MKRILSLILALIFCLSFIVSCTKENVSSSTETSSPTETSSSTLGEDESLPDEQESYKGIEPDEKVLMAPNQPHYYYMTPQYSCLTPYISIGAFVMDDFEELQDEFSRLGVDTTQRPLDSVFVTETVFETHYVFLLINYDLSVKGNPAKTIGYRDAFKVDDKYAIFADVLAYSEGARLDFDGMATYTIIDNSFLITPQGTSCRLLLIPKEELSSAPFDGDLLVYYTIYPN